MPVAIFSMEMSAEQLVERSWASLSQVPYSRILNGQLDDDEWPKITSASNAVVAAPIFIDDSSALSAVDIRARARRLKQREGIGLVVVDYLTLMRLPEGKENRNEKVGAVSWAMKQLARDLDIPVVLLSQLNRSLENRPNKRPVMSDLRDSGAIEQDADLIVFLYRDEVYREDSRQKGTAEVIIAKQRNGPTGTVRLSFAGEYVHFDNMLREDWERIQEPETEEEAGFDDL